MIIYYIWKCISIRSTT